MKKRGIGIVLSVLLTFNLGGCYMEKGNMISLEKNIGYDAENKINIEMIMGKINIYGYDGDEVSIQGKLTGSNEDIKMEKEGDEIYIKDLRGRKTNFNIFKKRNNIEMDIDIKIPKSFNGDINLEYGAGDMSISDLTCKNIDIEGGAGQLNIKNIVFEKLDYDGGVGKTNIALTEKCGDIDIDGGVGEVNIQMSEVGGNLSFDGGVGSAKIKIPENAPVYFNTNSGIGSTKLNAKTSGENIYKFEISVGVGEVEIYN